MSKKILPCTFGRRVRGFTLVELIITIAVASIILAIAIPSFRSMMSANNVTNTYNDLLAALRTARAEAVTRNAPIRVKATTSSWNGGWDVLTANNTAVRSYPARDAQYAVTPNPTVTEVSFDGRGALAAQACFEVKDSSGASPSKKYVKILKSGSVQKASTCP
ncbi:MAG TPA: GspH/FimT family pseudopilin [Chiayiivirga sp.]|jgi:type IV fimbrial biogenesis protein FimT|nr:GspH/FimT family pseudopilin [Chiayiivirga sp.]